jgi:CarD family transcriptional regulator
MNFNQGDHVVHQNFGVGIVVSIEGMKLADTGPSLFYRVDFFKTTVWVPVDDQSKGGLRPVTPKGHLARYRDLLKSSPVTLDSDYRKRQLELEERRDGGTFQGLCEVIRDLNALDGEKPLNSSEKKLYKKTRESLVLEWSATSGLSPAEAMRDIDGCLYKGRQGPHNV